MPPGPPPAQLPLPVPPPALHPPSPHHLPVRLISAQAGKARLSGLPVTMRTATRCTPGQSISNAISSTTIPKRYTDVMPPAVNSSSFAPISYHAIKSDTRPHMFHETACLASAPPKTTMICLLQANRPPLRARHPLRPLLTR